MSQPYTAESELQEVALQAPESIPDVGIRKALLEDLALKTLYVANARTLKELSSVMRLSYRLVDELFRRLRSEQLTEVTGMTGNTPEIALTARGRSHALDLLALNSYVGAAPVSLDSYIQQTRRQSVRGLEVHSPDISRAFSHLVLEPGMLTKLGTALNSGSSIFLYGPSGSGKTEIATTIPKVFHNDRVWIPFAVQSEAQIITVYDPHVHTKVDDPVAEDSDQRWVLCHRPAVLVGGELTIEMLELQLNPIAKFYTAPVQMKANNGVLIIDDFGRQRLRPEELLNRWVVPLDRRIDFLTLAGGRKVEIPFELFVIFATNLNPSTLADPAFMRRIQTKIKVGAVSREQFHEIFGRICRECAIECEARIIDDLIDVIKTKHKEPLRACQPRDILNQIRWLARYESRQPDLSRDSLLEAADAYFVSDTEDEEVESES